jgi:hypothetical protein
MFNIAIIGLGRIGKVFVFVFNHISEKITKLFAVYLNYNNQQLVNSFRNRLFLLECVVFVRRLAYLLEKFFGFYFFNDFMSIGKKFIFH